MTSGANSSSLPSALKPSAAVSVAKPSSRRISLSAARAFDSSSTMRIRPRCAVHRRHAMSAVDSGPPTIGVTE